MTGNLELPGPAFTPTGRYKPKYLNEDEQFTRVAVRSAHYSLCAWNPTRKPMGLDMTRVGRFDPVPGDDFDFLYASESCTDEAVAIQETLRGKLKRDAIGQYVLPLGELKIRSLVHFRLPQRVVLIDIRRQEGREHFGAAEEVQYSGERDKTRTWGEYFREYAPADAGGIAYNSTQETAPIGATSFMIWQPPARPAFTAYVIDSLDLGSSAGQDLVLRAFAGFNILIS